MSGAEGYVQVAADSTGKKVRNITLDVPQSDGSVATVVMQVITVRDENGEPMRTTDSEVLKAIYEEIRALRQMYGRATGQGFAGLQAQADDSSSIG